MVDTAALGAASLGDTVEASLHGFWGFDAYEGPRFRLMNAHARSWQLAGDDSALIVGRQDTVHLRADNVSCVDGIMLKDPAGKEIKPDWKPVKPDEVEIKLPLQDAKAGNMTLLVKQYGVQEPEPVNLRLFAEAGRFDGFALHAGESHGVLKGSRLDEVASLTFKNVTFVPGDPALATNSDELPMTALEPAAAALLKPERGINARVTLVDGRTLPLTVAVDAPRPRANLIGKVVQTSASGDASNIKLTDGGELPEDATSEERAIAATARIGGWRDDTREERMRVAQVAQMVRVILGLREAPRADAADALAVALTLLADGRMAQASRL